MSNDLLSALSSLPPLDDSVQPARLAEMIPELEFVMQTRVQVDPKVKTLGSIGGMGNRKMMTILGGDFVGPKLRGIILPGGGDWPLERPDGVGIVDARYTFETDDGVLINIKNSGYRHGSAESIAKLNEKREVADATTYYLRTYTQFESPDGKYDWLNKHVFIGMGERHPRVLFLRYYLLK